MGVEDPIRQQNILHGVQHFFDFVGFMKSRVPSSLKQTTIEHFQIGDFAKIEGQISEAWDRFGKAYLLEESEEAYGGTMYMLLDNMETSIGSEKWLSLGSGPGLYEAFFALKFPQLSIVSQDLSSGQLKVQEEIIKYCTKKSTVGSRVKLVRGSMKNLEEVGSGFQRILLINSLQWCPEWKSVIAQINKALSTEEGSRVYVTSGSVMTEDGHEITVGMNEDTIIDEFEKNELRARVVGRINITHGQYGRRTSRFYGVFERNSSLSDKWSERIMTGQANLIDYVTNGGIINKIDYTANVKRKNI